MGLLDFLKKPGSGAESGGLPSSGPSQAVMGPPGVGSPPGMGSSPFASLSNPQMPPARPMFPQTEQLSPSAPFGSAPFSRSSELQDVQMPQTQPSAVMGDDLGRKIGHLEDRMEIMNEKLDLIMRELRNIYEQGSVRRI